MHYPFFRQFGGRLFALVGLGILVLLLVGKPSRAFAQEEQNRLLSISVDQEAVQPTVHIRTQDPVGYRYTVYDSFEPVRVVLDFPGMDVSDLATPIQVDAPPLQEIRVSSFELTSGKLGRVELLLTSAASYDVSLSGSDFRISFTRPPSAPQAVAGEGMAAAAKPAPAPEVAEEQPPTAKPEEAVAEPVQVKPAASAEVVESVEVRDDQALLNTDGRIDKYRYFRLGAPPRLVVDIYGVRPGFKERSYQASLGFSRMRIGTYKDKTRFVFDAEGEALPGYAVDKKGNAIVVSWGEDVAAVSEPAPTAADVPVSVEAIDFQVEDGKSVLSVSLSGPAEIIEPAAEGDIVRFGVKNATISRALRRTVDTSAFPSAVRLITPYTVLAGDAQNVRFTVELKGPVPYDLRLEGNRLLFVVENGPFAEAAPAPVEKVEVPVTVPARPEEPVPAPAPAPAVAEAVAAPVAPVAPAAVEEGPVYTGEKVTLVFDDADIRRIFQLIAEVSDLNILVGDEVSGTITLRLIDVPWDQALDLILDIKGLGMLREGNVVRILPKDRIRAMRQAELTAVKEERELEPLVTEVIGVSYTDLGNISAPAGELLTDRGKITPDNRNKQIIVTDIPAVIEEIKKLVAILDTPERQVMIEARIVEANSDFARDLGVSWNLSFDNDPAGAGVGSPWDLSEGAISGGGDFVITPSVGTAGVGASFTFGRLGIDSTVLDLRLSALESSGYGKVISKPRVATLNGESATISQGDKIPYQTVSDEGTQTEFVDAVLSLDVTPVINPDDSVILEINASNSSIGSTVSTGAGSAPAIAQKEAHTKLLVKDGETTVIGGIFVETDSYSEAGIPILRKIPVLGYLFKDSSTSKTRRELLIFITPRILD